jgi:hypothetical protein
MRGVKQSRTAHECGLLPGALSIILALVRRDDYVELDARIVNLSEAPIRLGATFGAPGSTGFDDIEILDPERRFLYAVARTKDRCVCDTTHRRDRSRRLTSAPVGRLES